MLDDFYYSPIHLLCWMIVGHYIADFALQNDFMAQAKNRNTELGKLYSPWVLPAHAAIHGGFVWFFTNSLILGLLEMFCHYIIDEVKCDGKISFRIDQIAHFVCKVFWTMFACLFYYLS